MRKFLYIGFIFGFILPTLWVGFNQTASALESDATCQAVEMVFARGSGQGLKEVEGKRFEKQTAEALKGTSIGYHFYELGSEEYDGAKYEAVNVSNVFNGNALGAKFSSGMANDYGKSVKGGVRELKGYLEQRYKKCGKSSYYIIGGYSQGAQVVGQALPELSEDVRSQIVFASLFGDPKLHLPEGEGINPPACQGKNLSPWRRVIGNCDVDNGSLGARKPYLQGAMKDKVGLWCYNKDFVCGSSKNPFSTSGHLTYGEEGRAVDQAVAESVKRLRKVLPNEQAKELETKPREQAGLGPDVVFVIDTTGSMYYQIDQAKQFARDSADKIAKLNGRVALVAYRDLGDIYTSKIVSPLSSDLGLFRAGLNTLYPDGGGDEPEALLHALMSAFNGLDWRDGVAKAAIVLTDASYHDPDMVDRTTLDMVVKRSLEIDPVNVYPIVPSWLADRYQEIASRTAGEVMIDSYNTAEALAETITKIDTRPVALLKLSGYSADIKQPITFDASDSYVEDGEITSYEWDFDGDGEYDLTTAEPIVEYAYQAEFDGLMQVRLRASNDTVSSASATVQIGVMNQSTTPSAPLNLKADVVSTLNGASEIRVSWSASDELANEWLISVNGVAVGRSPGDNTSVVLTDIQNSEDVVVAVAGVSIDYEVGDVSETLVSRQSEDVSSTTPTKLSLTEILMKLIKKVVSIALGIGR